ncbi:winged helix-turn-helix transcriptional regulator [Candidatus Lokiarchaeum ossiferum]
MSKMPENTKIKRQALLFLASTCMASYSGTRRRYGREFKKEDVLEQGTRSAIFELIRENEGLHFRKICRLLDKKMGVVQYHVSVLEKHGLIRAIRDGRYKCFFATNGEKNRMVSPDDRDPKMESLRETIITSLRRKTPQVLIQHLVKENVASHQALSNVAQVSPQAITFHTQRLQSFGIIESQKEGRQKFYTLSDNARLITDNLVRR